VGADERNARLYQNRRAACKKIDAETPACKRGMGGRIAI
jgi:hypothetical protein